METRERNRGTNQKKEAEKTEKQRKPEREKQINTDRESDTEN